jgi:urease accessory protein
VTRGGVADRHVNADLEPPSAWPDGGTAEGELHLGMVRDPSGRTVLRERRQRFPLRTTVPFYLDEQTGNMAFVYVQNPTGGVFGGDRLHTVLACDRGTRVHLTTQSATKIYRTEGVPARQEVHLKLAEEAYVEHIPDTLIPHAGADYEQFTRVELAPGAMLITAETVAAGRVGRGERFAYQRLVLETLACRDNEELFAERLRLEPARVRPDRLGVLGGWDYLVSVTVLAPEQDGAALAAALDAELAARGDVCGAAGELPQRAGAFSRALASDAVSAGDVMWRAWAVARRYLLGVSPPARRK